MGKKILSEEINKIYKLAGRRNLSEEINKMRTLAGLINENESRVEEIKEAEESLNESDDLIASYTHFAIDKSTGEIMDGWEYEDLEPIDIKYYATIDLKDNFPERRPSEFKVVTKRFLEKQGIDPQDTKNWYKISDLSRSNDIN